MHIVIPCKSLQTGKSRLAACLDQRARHDLCRDMLLRTLGCALSVTEPGNVRVLTGDAEAIEVAESYSAGILSDPGAGLNAALEAARQAVLAVAPGARALLILPIDLPFASPAAIRDACVQSGDVVIAADQAGSGTNLLLLRGEGLRRLAFCYGTNSYALHLRQAQRHGLALSQVNDWRLAFDIDDSSQYAAWRSRLAELP